MTMYTACKLTQESHNTLVRHFAGKIPNGWIPVADHMTMIPPPVFATTTWGKDIHRTDPAHTHWYELRPLLAVTFAFDDLAMAVGIETAVPSMNKRKHVTVAVNGAKGGLSLAVHSNDLTNWTPIFPILLWGYVENLNA